MGRAIFRLAVLETTFLGVVGAALGIAIGVVLAFAVSAVGIPMPPPPNSEAGFTATIRVVPAIIAAAFALGAFASVTASLLPARHLARLSVVQALRRGI